MRLKIDERHSAATLAFCNTIRAQLGLKPARQLRKGRPSKAAHCVIARTIGRSHGIVHVWPSPRVNDHGPSVYIGNAFMGVGRPAVNKFALAFDREELPDLIAA